MEDGFPHVPPGCSIQLQKVAAQHVLENIRSQLGSRRAGLVARIRGFTAQTGKELTLANFLDHYEFDAEAIYKRGTWSSLCVAAGQQQEYLSDDEAWFSRGLLRMSRAESATYLQFVRNVLDERFDEAKAPLGERLMATMLYYAFFTRASGSSKTDSLNDFFERLRAAPRLCAEMRELVAWRLSRIDHVEQELNVQFACPLRVHSSYHLDEILAAFGSQIAGKPSSFREGVHHVKELKTDLLFVTLNKSQKRYSPTTMYKDYAISDRLFHWETRSTTSDTSPTGKRYISHEAKGHHILLFVRAEPSTTQGHGAPYTLLGKVVHVSHSGSRPMAITWRLESPMPASLLKECRKLAAG